MKSDWHKLTQALLLVLAPMCVQAADTAANQYAAELLQCDGQERVVDALLDAVESGLDPAALVTATLPLADAGPALMTMDAPDAPRGVRLIDPRR